MSDQPTNQREGLNMTKDKWNTMELSDDGFDYLTEAATRLYLAGKFSAFIEGKATYFVPPVAEAVFVQRHPEAEPASPSRQEVLAAIETLKQASEASPFLHYRLRSGLEEPLKNIDADVDDDVQRLLREANAGFPVRLDDEGLGFITFDEEEKAA